MTFLGNVKGMFAALKTTYCSTFSFSLSFSGTHQATHSPVKSKDILKSYVSNVCSLLGNEVSKIDISHFLL